MAEKKLTPKQERFCQEYMIDLNATQAAIRAGYSAKTAKEQGARLLTNVNIRENVEHLQKRKEKELNITFEDCLKRAWQIATEEERDRSRGLEMAIKMLGFYERHNEQKQPYEIPQFRWADDEEDDG